MPDIAKASLFYKSENMIKERITSFCICLLNPPKRILNKQTVVGKSRLHHFTRQGHRV